MNLVGPLPFLPEPLELCIEHPVEAAKVHPVHGPEGVLHYGVDVELIKADSVRGKRQFSNPCCEVILSRLFRRLGDLAGYRRNLRHALTSLPA